MEEVPEVPELASQFHSPKEAPKRFQVCTPPKTNMEPKNGGLKDDCPFQLGDFKVPC